MFPLALWQLKFFIVGVDYFTKWIKVEVVAKITTERVHYLSWYKIMCRFILSSVIVSNNETKFASTTITDFCHELGVQRKFVYVVYPQASGQA